MWPVFSRRSARAAASASMESCSSMQRLPVLPWLPGAPWPGSIIRWTTSGAGAECGGGPGEAGGLAARPAAGVGGAGGGSSRRHRPAPAPGRDVPHQRGDGGDEREHQKATLRARGMPPRIPRRGGGCQVLGATGAATTIVVSAAGADYLVPGGARPAILNSSPATRARATRARRVALSPSVTSSARRWSAREERDPRAARRPSEPSS